MNSRNALAVALLLAWASSPAAAQTAPNRTALDELDQKVPAWMDQARIPAVAIAGIRDGELAWTRVYGERAPGVSADEHTVFNVASLTKPAFSMMVMQMVADGQLGLDSRLSDHWVDPEITDDDRHLALTPRVALSHQTGFQNWRGNNRLAFAFDPGAKHEYSGEGFEYLRRAVERKTGQSMQALMRKHVLDPAGMEASFGWNDGLDARIATGFDEVGDPLAMQHLQQRSANAAAYTFTTVADYGRFIAWVVDGAGLPDALFEDMQRPQAMHKDPAEAFGLGWKLARQEGATTALWHDGREGGVRTLAIARPAMRDGIVVLSNSSNGELIMRSVVETGLSGGAELMKQFDGDVWRYLQTLSGQELGRILQVIAQSPSFTSKLMHAVDTTLVQPSPLDSWEKATAHEAIDPFALAMLDGRVDRQQVERLVSIIIEADNDGQGLLERFSLEQAQAWAKGLDLDADADDDDAAPSGIRATIEVPQSVLADYAGVYLVPSSQLRITVTANDGQLTVTAPDTPAITFHPASERLFFMKESATDFEFVRDGKGRVTGVKIIWDGTRSEFADRVR